MVKTLLFPILFSLAFILSCSPTESSAPAEPPASPKEPAPPSLDFQAHYDSFQVEGVFVLHDLQKDSYTYHNEAWADSAFIPASTFKICNSLIALETGVAPDEHFALPWDGVERQVKAWNKDTHLAEAFRNSTVWFYQEIATRIGEERMGKWLKKLDYGNADISGGITHFWLTGGLRTTPNQQVDFLKRLVQDELPLEQRTMDLVKEMMLREETETYKLRGKTGWGVVGDKDTGWFVGYLERGEDRYIFANCLRTGESNHPTFGEARIEIVKRNLQEMRLLE